MPTLDEIRQFLRDDFPQTSVEVEAVGERRARVRQPIDQSHLRPGGTVCGPVMMAVADVAAYVAVLGQVGIVPLAVTTSLGINFLRKPAPERALIGEAELIKAGKRLVVADVRLYSEGDAALVAQASVTYSVPPQRS
jgi:uncharacterized protein (TIGR00369 family)